MTDAVDPFKAAETGVTIKYGKEYDKTWATFRGTGQNLVQEIAYYFGLDAGEYKTLHELVGEATALAHASSSVASQAGGRTVKKSEQASTEQPAATEAPAEDKPSPLLERVEDATTRDDLKKLWAAHKEDFESDADLKAAWKAKGKSLPA